MTLNPSLIFAYQRDARNPFIPQIIALDRFYIIEKEHKHSVNSSFAITRIQYLTPSEHGLKVDHIVS